MGSDSIRLQKRPEKFLLYSVITLDANNIFVLTGNIMMDRLSNTLARK